MGTVVIFPFMHKEIEVYRGLNCIGRDGKESGIYTTASAKWASHVGVYLIIILASTYQTTLKKAIKCSV